MTLRKFPSALTLALFGLILAACNTTGHMDVPKIETGGVSLERPKSEQASFALSRIVSGIRTGTVVAHFPAFGVAGVEGSLCNDSFIGSQNFLEWSAGSKDFGNWRTNLGHVFFDALASRGVNVKGNPNDLFRAEEEAQSAEFLIGARIVEIRSNFCHAHMYLSGQPLGRYSGEMFMTVDWTIFSALRQQEVLKATTQGYFKQRRSIRNGLEVTFQNSFANAAENLLASEDFVKLAERRSDGPAPDRFEIAGEVIPFDTIPESRETVQGRIEDLLPAVVTVRAGDGHGSGFAIARNGMILTNQHVVGTASNVAVILNNGLEVRGEVVRRNQVRDVALVKIPITIPSALPIREKAVLRSESIFVVGSPLDEELQSTVTTGIVSGRVKLPPGDLEFIQSDAAISPGNSGGPMLDENGNVVALSVASFSDRRAQNLNLFIPIRSALDALKLQGKSTGS